MAPPESTALAVAELKRYLPDPVQHIRLDDFVRGEVDRTVEALDVANFPLDVEPTTADVVFERIARYEVQMQRVLSLLAVGVYFGEPDAQDALWVRSLLRIDGRPKPLSGKKVLIELQMYPTMLSALAVGLAGVLRGHLSPFMKIVTTEVPLPQYGTKEPLLMRALPPYALGSITLQVMQERQRLLTPASDHVHAVLKEALRPTGPSDDEYDRAFDTLEYMMAVMARRAVGWGNFLGRFWHSYYTWGASSPDLPSLEPYRSDLMGTGFFSSDEDLDAAIAELNEAARTTPRII